MRVGRVAVSCLHCRSIPQQETATRPTGNRLDRCVAGVYRFVHSTQDSTVDRIVLQREWPPASRSLTGGLQGIVQRVSVGDGASRRSGRGLDRSGARTYSLIDTPQDSTVSRIVLQGEDASLTGHLAYSGESDPLAAEPILASCRVPQQDGRRIAVILKRGIEDSDGE